MATATAIRQYTPTAPITDTVSNTLTAKELAVVIGMVERRENGKQLNWQIDGKGYGQRYSIIYDTWHGRHEVSIYTLENTERVCRWPKTAKAIYCEPAYKRQFLAPLIWAALGGKDTLEKCLGAKDFQECSNAVYFKVRPEGKINAIRIVTDGNGLFTLQYMHVYSDVKAGIGGESRTNWADEINTMKRICADEMVFRIDAVFCPIIENSLMYAIVDSAPIADEPVLVVHEQAPEGYEIPAKIDNEPEIILDSEPEKSDIVDKETTNTRTDNMPEHEPIPPQISAKARALADEYFDLTGGKYFVVLASVPASEFIPASECERPKGVKPVIVKGVEYFHIDDFPPAPKPAKKARAAKPELTVEILPIHKQILKAITDGNDTPELLAGYLFLPTDKLENELREMAKFALIETIEGKLIKV